MYCCIAASGLYYTMYISCLPFENNFYLLEKKTTGKKIDEGFATQKNLVHLPENRFWNPKSESRIIENDARIQKWFKKTVYRFTEIVFNYLNEKDQEKDRRQNL